MAISGHNVSVRENSFPRESQSQPSKRLENSGTRESSLLQMWRELEDEHVVSYAREKGSKRILKQRSDGGLSMTDSNNRNGEDIVVSEDVSVGENEFGQSRNADSRNINCEHSSDLGEIERERVRQIFREWMNIGGRELTSNVSRRNSSSRAQWLGETEQERVRHIRECAQMNDQQRATCIESRDEQVADVGGHIEQVIDGVMANQNEDRIEHAHKGFRNFGGRQALLDMLKKAEGERQAELQELQELQAVSHFAHRKRIQSLLRGRFLRNDRRVVGDRSTSLAASELGLLRQKQPVSGLREGFLSRLDTSGCGPASSKCSDIPSNVDTKGDKNAQNHVDNSDEVRDVFSDQSEPENEETENQRFLDGITDLVADVVQDVSWQETSIHVEECQDGNRDVTGQVLDGDWQENIANELSLETLQDEAGNLNETAEASYEHFPTYGERSRTHTAIENLEQNLVQYIDGQESASQVEQRQEEHRENAGAEWQEASVEYNMLMGGGNEGASDMHHEDGGNEERGHDTQHDHGSLHEITRNWLEGSYNQEPVTVGRTDIFYFPDDDDVQSMELRELLNRRSVSTLLHSGFRESLDQFMQSYVERQNHPFIDLELNETFATPASVEQDVEQQSRVSNEIQADADVSPLALPSPRMPYMQQPLWDRNSYHHYNWAPYDVHQRFGIDDLDMINDLRFDMARLQQRMNNMERMLGACMEMQLELQRTIRQEVAAALNRSAGSQGAGMIDDNSSREEFNWDNVRKGICCMCSKGKIDSLLYRCGHMCACSKCANKLVQGGRKCPMCHAPVVEVIRAYSME